MTTLRCSHCGHTLEPGVERCPECLRRHTEETVEDRPGFDVVRWGFLLGAWALCVPAAWAYTQAGPWLEGKGLQLSAILFVGVLVLLPPRFAFSGLLRRARWTEALSALGMVWGFAVLLAGAVALATRLTTNAPVAVLVGLIIFLAPLIIVPTLWLARRRQRSLARAWRVGILRFAGVSAAVVTLFGLRLLLAPAPTPAPPVVVANPKALIDPLDLEHAPVERAWRVDAAGLKHLHLASEAAPVERAVLRLKAELINALSELDQTADAAAVVTLWVPLRFESASARTALAKESDLLNDVLTKSKRKTLRGEPVRVVMAFGELPD